MKKILLLILVTISVQSYAQLDKKLIDKPGVISGKVIDNATKESLPYVNIVIRDTAKKIITGGITDINGLFTVKNIPEGVSLVEIQFIGFKTYSKQIKIEKGNRKIDLGTIALLEDSAMLDEVVVRAETSTVVQKVDRKVINVGKDLTAAGTTASELLNNVQSVSVDSQTGNISLRGNENVRVLVDGKPTNISTAQLLKQIPSTAIKSIELITNPSAKYNPEGMSGIINIVLNKNANMGFNGSVDTGITVGHYAKYNVATNMNYKTGKVNFFGNYGYNSGDNYNHGFIERSSNNSIQNFLMKDKNQSHLAKIGADIYLDSKNTLSVYTSQNWYTGGGVGNILIKNNNVLTSDAPISQDTESISSTYNLNYKHDFNKEGHNIEFEATYSNTDAPETSKNQDLLDANNPFLNYTNSIQNKRNNSLINLDYTNPLSENAKLEMGLEYRVNNTSNINSNTQHQYVYDNNGAITGTTPIGDSSFEYDRKIYSGYINYAYTLDKFTMQLGARVEQFQIDGTFNRTGLPTANVKDDIFTVYPSAFFTYTPSQKNQFQLSYSRRVDRPSIQQVNPIREWSTPLVTSIGNENLNPQFTNSFEVNYTRQIERGSVTFGSFYRVIQDNISRVTYKDPSDPTNVRQILSFTNFDDTDAYGLEFSLNYRVNSWWRINSSVDFYAQKQKGIVDLTTPNAQQIEVQNNAFNGRISNSFKASKNLSFQLFAMYRGSEKDIQWEVEPMWMINTGASLNVLEGKGTFTFRVNDLFQGMKFAFKSKTPFAQNGRFKWESRTAYVGFNYRFGSGKNKAKERRDRDDNIKENTGGF
ncbi:TonB-dependent receptor [Polaribacter pacificus]|uniref:TonB-dependent receptor n=1 Tax=Polaribacter pacificus TaxID=1775173 RepID=A0A917I1J4_9FLAO|nr:TonB-dependent receptor [Polaribacter pacificus]GGH01215.1 TonB-dependent receptor [Polaribacter pacificus]